MYGGAMLRYLVILGLLLSILVSCNNTTSKNVSTEILTPYGPARSLELIASGSNHACISTNQGVQCWGDNTFGQLNVPPSLTRPTEIIAGETSTCAIQDQKVICWGNNGLSKQLYPNLDFLVNPRKITSADPGSLTCNRAFDGLTCWDSGTPTCAQTDIGLKCWGGFINGQDVQIRDANQIVVTPYNLCFLSEGIVKCRADQSYHRINFFDGLTKIKQFAVGPYFSYCALFESKAVCSDSFGTTTQQPYEVKLNAPKQIKIGQRFACALDNDGVKCWGDKSSDVLKVPELKNPRTISAGLFHVCALDDTGVVCWGNKKISNPYDTFKPSIRDESLQKDCAYGSSQCIKNELMYVYAQATQLSKIIYSNDFYESRDDGFSPLKIRSFKVSAIPTESADLELELCQHVTDIQKVLPRTIYGNFFLNARKSNDPSCELNFLKSALKVKSLGYIWSKPQVGLQPLHMLNAVWASVPYAVYPVGDFEKFDRNKYEFVHTVGYVIAPN